MKKSLLLALWLLAGSLGAQQTNFFTGIRAPGAIGDQYYTLDANGTPGRIALGATGFCWRPTGTTPPLGWSACGFIRQDGTLPLTANWNAGAFTITATTFAGNATTATTATSATNTAITDDTTTAATMYPTWVTANTGNLPQKVSSTKLSFVPSTGILTATGFAGPVVGNVTGNVSGSSGSTTGLAASATILATTRAIYGNNFDGSAALTQVIGSAYGGTGIAYFTAAGPTVARVFTFPDAAATILYSGGALGTPASGTMTNVGGTAASLTVGLATNTVSKTGTGSTYATSTVTALSLLASANGSTIPASETLLGRATTDTLTNKRVTRRSVSAASYSTSTTINSDAVDIYIVTAQAGALLFNNPSGTPTEGQTLWIAVTGTAARALTWGTAFEAGTVPLPTTTVTTNRLDVGFVWRADTNKWHCAASS